MTSTGMLQWAGRIAAVAMLVGLTIPTMAQDNMGGSDKISFDATVDVVSSYYFRGYKQEDSGLIIQPDASVTLGLTEAMGQVGAVDLKVGLWNSIHSKQTAEGAVTGAGLNDSWYEADFYAELSTTIAENTSVSVGWVAYNSPNGAFSNVQDLAFTVGYDDSAVMGDYSVNPYLSWVFEIQGTNSGDLLSTRKQYVEIGIGRTYTIVASETSPIKLSIPLTAGLSFDGYYRDSQGKTTGLGYVDLGLIASMPLPNAGYGDWEVYGGADVIYMNAQSVDTSNGGKEWAVVGKVGVSMSF